MNPHALSTSPTTTLIAIARARETGGGWGASEKTARSSVAASSVSMRLKGAPVAAPSRANSSEAGAGEGAELSSAPFAIVTSSGSSSASLVRESCTEKGDGANGSEDGTGVPSFGSGGGTKSPGAEVGGPESRGGGGGNFLTGGVALLDAPKGGIARTGCDGLCGAPDTELLAILDFTGTAPDMGLSSHDSPISDLTAVFSIGFIMSSPVVWPRQRTAQPPPRSPRFCGSIDYESRAVAFRCQK